MKKFVIVIIITIILAVVVFAVIHINTDSYGINKISTYEAFKEYADGLQMRLDDTELERILEIKDKIFEQLKPPMMSDVCVFEITAGKAYMQKGSMYVQDAVIKNVIEGDAAMSGKSIYLAKAGGIIVKEDLNKVCIDTSTCVNIMIPEERYLVFCAKSEATDVVDSDIPLYESVPSKFALLRIDRDDTEAVLDYGQEQEDDRYYTDYKAYAEQEFFVISKDTLLEYIKIKHEILKKYGVE
ncbi:MAG: hypothetical protein K2K56_06800 [Lachnospiraceae bacterium]|nr:hypothetical protein [Lachnospiraceae bacterium]